MNNVYPVVTSFSFRLKHYQFTIAIVLVIPEPRYSACFTKVASVGLYNMHLHYFVTHHWVWNIIFSLKGRNKDFKSTTLMGAVNLRSDVTVNSRLGVWSLTDPHSEVYAKYSHITTHLTFLCCYLISPNTVSKWTKNTWMFQMALTIFP